MASIILPPGSAPANPSEGELYYDNTAKQVKFRDNSGFKALGTADLQGEPHIITKKLFPAYLGKLLDDTTSHSGDYGTEQADGRMYYYTDIAGSKPIHDPRIGVHFGSQRHKFKSLQLLEQETATHGKNVYSVDGREWLRAVGNFVIQNAGQGLHFNINDTTSFFEITGYFNQFNWLEYLAQSGNARNRWILAVDGTATTTESTNQVSVDSPLANRFVDAHSLRNINTGLTTPRIVTIKMTTNSATGNAWAGGCELIAQDTTSSSTKVQIQVPAQDVVSYGRKFSVSATAQHYDPFNGFTSGDANALATKVDTATSLGLSKWLHSSTYYRPYNGMRVVKWIDENGAIKTSVTCMPPNAKSFADSSSLTNANAKANASVANDTFYPTFEAHTTSVIEDNLHEECRTFMTEEFGNGAANGGTNATYADASMLSGTSDDIAYVMDDGLTALAANAVTRAGRTTSMPGYINIGSGDSVYTTFIGTGVTLGVTNWAGDAALKHHVAFNLPYGTHILKVTNSSDTVKYIIDGIEVQSAYQTYWSPYEYSIFQPKRPPIPDSACVLADYMVFADFKPQTTHGTQLISKGVRRQNISRDVFFDETDGDSFNFHMYGEISDGFQIHLSGTADSDTSFKMRIPSFGTNYVHRGYQSDTRTKLFIGDTDNDSNATKNNTADYGSYAHLTSDLTLGIHQFGSNAVSGQLGNASSFDIVTPVHTSHHYQSFETPFLNELVGGDRNMEQTNLVCSPDGKTWDGVTRDVSYLGSSTQFVAAKDGGHITNGAFIWDTLRGGGTDGTTTSKKSFIQKNIAVGYDRIIILKEGLYQIEAHVWANSNDTNLWVYINATSGGDGNGFRIRYDLADDAGASAIRYLYFKRGDYIYTYAEGSVIHGTHLAYNGISITKLN